MNSRIADHPWALSVLLGVGLASMLAAWLSLPVLIGVAVALTAVFRGLMRSEGMDNDALASLRDPDHEPPGVEVTFETPDGGRSRRADAWGRNAWAQSSELECIVRHKVDWLRRGPLGHLDGRDLRLRKVSRRERHVIVEGADQLLLRVVRATQAPLYAQLVDAQGQDALREGAAHEARVVAAAFVNAEQHHGVWPLWRRALEYI